MFKNAPGPGRVNIWESLTSFQLRRRKLNFNYVNVNFALHFRFNVWTQGWKRTQLLICILTTASFFSENTDYIFKTCNQRLHRLSELNSFRVSKHIMETCHCGVVI